MKILDFVGSMADNAAAKWRKIYRDWAFTIINILYFHIVILL